MDRTAVFYFWCLLPMLALHFCESAQPHRSTRLVETSHGTGETTGHKSMGVKDDNPRYSYKNGVKSKSGTRYIVYDRTIGQYNNQIMSLEMAACLAMMSNRTVAFGGFIRNTRLSKEKKAEASSIPLGAYIDVGMVKRKKMPIVDWTDFLGDIKSYDTLEYVSFEHLPRIMNYSYLQSVRTIIEKSLYSDVALVKLPLLFYWRLEGKNRCITNYTEAFYTSVIPKKTLREEADIYISKNLGRSYGAIHYRRLDGKCVQAVGDIVSNIKKYHPKVPLSKYFLASDRSDLTGDKIIVNTFNASTFDEELSGPYYSGIIDMYILSKGTVLYINPSSTLAKNAVMYNKFLHKLNSKVVSYIGKGLVYC